MRVVFDSNIYISALTLPGGQAEKALFRILDGADTLLISKPILDEVLLVLARKFSHDRDELSQVAVTLTEMAEVVKPSHAITVLADDPDNRILECAEEGDAHYIYQIPATRHAMVPDTFPLTFFQGEIDSLKR